MDSLFDRSLDKPCSNNPDLWFSERREETKKAAELCRSSCPLMMECLAFGVELHKKYSGSTTPLLGVWGGLTKTDRDELKLFNPLPKGHAA